MVIYLEPYRKRRAARISELAPARAERQCGNSIPVPGRVTARRSREPRQPSPDLPDDFAAVDIDEFLDRVYGLATQI